MRRTIRKNEFREINKQIICVGVLFVIFIVLGTYLNKIWPSYQQSMSENLNPIIKYYNSSFNIKDIIISNMKNDIIFMSLIFISSFFVITFPIIIIIFMLKGLSIGYTINSIILTMKLKGIKIILILLLRNIIIIPGSVILILISFNYIKEVIYQLKKNKGDNILFLGKRYFLNSLIVLAITVGLQLTLNFISTSIIRAIFK